MRVTAIVILGLATALGGCAASIPPVAVTRFHLGQAIAPGPVQTAPLPGIDGASIEYRTYAIAVARELARLNFPEGDGPYVAEIAFARDTRERLARRSPVTIGIGGGSFGGGFGIGLGTSFGVGGDRSKADIVSHLEVRLKRKADQAVIWEGRAQTEAPANAPAAQPGLAAEKLASALFAGFPGESGRTITVP